MKKQLVKPPAALKSVLRTLQSQGSRANVEGMARFGVSVAKAYGVSPPAIIKLAKQIGHDRRLAQQLWATGVLDARALAVLVDSPEEVTQAQMEKWAKDFDSWSIVDHCCGKLFDKTPFAYRKAEEWSRREEEYVKRAAFSLMAALAVHDKKAPDEKLLKFLPVIRRESTDERNFVKKAVNWPLRQIGKRNRRLNQAAIKTARAIRELDSKSARWIAADALRELTGDALQRRLRAREVK